MADPGRKLLCAGAYGRERAGGCSAGCRYGEPGRDWHRAVSYTHLDVYKRQQYNLILYDKGLIQAEFLVNHDKIVKERLVFIKKHNKIWNMSEIEEHEILEEDWFDDEDGIPIMLRIDYAPDDHVDGDHAAAHLSLIHISGRWNQTR